MASWDWIESHLFSGGPLATIRRSQAACLRGDSPEVEKPMRNPNKRICPGDAPERGACLVSRGVPRRLSSNEGVLCANIFNDIDL